MSQRQTFLLALAAAATFVAGAAEACPCSHVRFSPSPMSTLAAGETVTLDGFPVDALEQHAPALWSDDDLVPLKVSANQDGHIEMTVTRDLQPTRYVLVFTRTATGETLARPMAPLRRAVWNGATARPSFCPYAASNGGFSIFARGLGRFATFFLLPFLASYLATTLAIRRHRRRVIREILL